jgi:pilus assembly protein CpaE
VIAAVRELSHAPVVLLVATRSTELLEEAQAAGAADVLLAPLPVETLVFALEKAAHAGRRRAESATARIVPVFSPKGGTGKSTVASNLAAAFATRGERTLLLDLDLQFGATAVMLGLEPRTTLVDALAAAGDLDADKLRAYVTPYAANLDVLPAPLRPEEAESVSEARVAELLAAAADAYDVVVVDTSPFFHGPALSTLDRADVLLLVCAPDVPTLKNVRLTLQTLELLGVPRDKIRLVLNRSSANVGLGAREIGAVLGCAIDFELPADHAVVVGVNTATPVVLRRPQAPFSLALLALRDRLFTAPAQQPRRRRFALGRR